MGMMMKKIISCRECGIRKNQQPIVDKVPFNDNLIMCVDFAAHKLPEKEMTDSGSGKCFPIKELLRPAMEEMEKNGYDFYYTYLLKCVPLLNGMIRKPFSYELRNCFRHLCEEIDELQPKAVLLLGHNTYLPVLSLLGLRFKKWNGVYFDIYWHKEIGYIPVSHPAMLEKSRPHQYEIYIEGINNVLQRCIKH